MEIEQYDIEDFVCDHSFQQFCREENEATVAFWNAWLNANPDKQELVNEARQLVTFLSAGQGMRRSQLEQLKTGLRQREFFEARMQAEPDNKASDPRSSLKYLSSIAACLIIGLLCFFYLNHHSKSESGELTDPTEFASRGPGRKTIILPDGTLVTLNKNSRLQLGSEFSSTNRSATFEGEGFFEVKHDEAHPFIVQTKDITVKVLGTVFNLNTFPDGHGLTETSLLKGKVEVTLRTASDTKYVLLPNEKLVTRNTASHIEANKMALSSASSASKEVDIKPEETVWLRNRLVLSDERLEDIAGKLEKWYGIDIDFADQEVKSYRYTGTFETETVLRTLEALQLSYPFAIKTEAGKIIIAKQEK